MAANVGQTSEDDEGLQACYESFVQRRRARGELSIRTPEGFERLQKRYRLPVRSDPQAVSDTNEAETNIPISDQKGLKDVEMRSAAALFLNSRISRIITDNCWPLAHYGGGTPHNERDCAGWKLALDKYSTFTFRLIQWAFPELPRRTAQELAEYDWDVDRKFEEFGRDGLSLQGFKSSLLDLVITCTDGSAGKCLEFLNLMTRWLQHSLPPYPTCEIIPPVVNDSEKATKTCSKPVPAIAWNTIPLLTMTPVAIDSQGLYCKLKAKVSAAPMAIMVMATDENPIEVVLTTSSKLLISTCETRTNVNRNVTISNSLCGELKRQGCWTFCLNATTPSIVLVPNASISRRTKALHGCFRTFDLDKRDMEHDIQVEERESIDVASSPEASCTDANCSDAEPSASSLVTLFTSISEQCSLRFGGKSSCYRMEHMSTRMFTIDPTTTRGKPFSVTLTAALLQNTNSAVGPGAPAALSSTFEAVSTFTVGDRYGIDPPKADEKLGDAHTFVIILKTPIPVKKGHAPKHQDVTLPQQWFTSLNSANETKTIIFESCSKLRPSDERLVDKQTEGCAKERSRMEMYNIFIFTLHGVYIEVTCNAIEPEQNTRDEDCETETEDPEESEKEETPVTSSLLLKEMLLVQKMRQLEKAAEPLPDMVIGTQVCTAKPVTTAESLRTKVLRSRQDERHTRLEELETAIRSKLLDSKSRPQTMAGPESTEDNVESSSPLEKRVDLLTTFFHEMAEHQPKLDDLHRSAAEAAEAAAEQQLLQNFGEMFDQDEDLQNALDEEKWSTATAKATRRRESMPTNLPRAMASAAGTRDQIEDDKCVQWTSEDYEHTAQYIEQLMKDVVTHANQQQELEDSAPAERKRAVMDQLVASWQYTQHRVDRPATRERVREIEQKRRNQWMQSQHVHVFSDVASARRSDKPKRPALILPKQRFLTQEQSIPSNAVWETTGSMLSSDPLAAAGLVSSARPMSPNNENSSLRPQRPQRPMTVTSAGRPSNITALRSAALTRARVRRIRSAHSTFCGDSTPNRLQIKDPQQQEQELSSPQEQPSTSDTSSSALAISSESHFRVVNQQNRPNSRTPSKSANNSKCKGGSLSLEVTVNTSELSATCSTSPRTIAVSIEENITKPVSRKRRLKKKRRSTDGFRRQVLELVTISAQLQAVAREEWRQAQGVGSVEELDSVPIRPSKPKFN